MSTLSLLTQMLIHNSRNTLTDTPRNDVLNVIWAFLSLVQLTHKIKHQGHPKGKGHGLFIHQHWSVMDLRTIPRTFIPLHYWTAPYIG